MDIPDLSKLKHEEKQEEPSVIKARTAFLVIVDENGEIYAQPDLAIPLTRSYFPSADDIYSACAVVQRDITVQISAQHTVLGMQQMAMMQAQRLQEAQLLQGINLKSK